MPVDIKHWKHLYEDVVTTGLCTGCSACVIACPHDVLGYDSSNGVYKPYHFDTDGGIKDCTHGDKGCTLCTRACPRFGLWEPEIDTFLYGRERSEEEVSGIYQEVCLMQTTDTELLSGGQDGGLVSALIIYALQENIIDAALVSKLEGDGSTWKAIPHVARSRADVLASAGSRYTYCANPSAYSQAIELGSERIGLVGMGCQVSAPGAMAARRAGKIARRFALRIGLLCSKTFDDAIFDELFDEKYAIKRESIKKMNIKGVFQIYTEDGGYHEIPLKEAHQWTREGCLMCPDFAAEHSDISAGGIGVYADWTLTVVRSDLGKKILDDMEEKNLILRKPIEEDPGALKLMDKLSAVSRKRLPKQDVNYKKRIDVRPSLS